MNVLGVIAVAASLLAFALTYRYLCARPVAFRIVLLGAFALLAIPALLFAVYYLHILPEQAWFYTLRSRDGTELLVIFAGCAAGAVASLLPRLLLGGPLFALLALGIVPYIKPVMASIPESLFQEHWKDGICFQSTAATCGPASVSTLLRRLGSDSSERDVARASYSYAGGTEVWYLARYVRSRNFVPRFEFRETFSPSVGLPALVGVRLGGAGHFIAVFEVRDDAVAFAGSASRRGAPPALPVSAALSVYGFPHGHHQGLTAC